MNLTVINNTENLVAAYEQICNDMETAEKIYQRCEAAIKAATGHEYAHTTKKVIYGPLYQKDTIKAEFWASVIRKSGIRNILSIKGNDELDKQLQSKKDLPEFTIENIHSFIDGLASKAGNMVKDAIREVFDLLTPQNSKYKSNSKYEIGKKAIIDWFIDQQGFISNFREREINAIERLFRIIDGNTTPKNSDGIYYQICRANRNGKNTYEDEYFKARWYRTSGTLHLEFKRRDLVRRINAMAGENLIKP